MGPSAPEYAVFGPGCARVKSGKNYLGFLSGLGATRVGSKDKQFYGGTLSYEERIVAVQ